MKLWMNETLYVIFKLETLSKQDLPRLKGYMKDVTHE